jgi:hypothetical protein
MASTQEFCENGFVVKDIFGCTELIQECLDKLTLIASRGLERKFSNLSNLGDLLVSCFSEDKESYVGLLKAFANSPTVQNFASLPGVIALARELGVNEPSLVTPPILHVVKDELILNREKVFTPAHQDVVSTRGSIGQLVFWIPLHSIENSNYGIEAWPGSHILGELPSTTSGFGHTVSKAFIPDGNPAYLEMNVGQVVAFSQYLVHQTHTEGKFRLAVSFRFNDALDTEWAKRKYFCAFDRTTNVNEYNDARERAPKQSKDYFRNLATRQKN